MPVPERVKELSFREFFIVIARAGGQFIAIGRDRSGKQVARADGPAIDEVEADLKSELLKLSNDFVDLPGAINLFRRAFPGGFHSAFYDYYERECRRGGVCARSARQGAPDTALSVPIRTRRSRKQPFEASLERI